MLTTALRSQLYVEAEARMDSYETEDGQKRTALNLLQRKCSSRQASQNDY